MPEGGRNGCGVHAHLGHDFDAREQRVDRPCQQIVQRAERQPPVLQQLDGGIEDGAGIGSLARHSLKSAARMIERWASASTSSRV